MSDTQIKESATMPAIQIHDMTIAYQKKPVLWDVDLDIPEGVLVGIIGPNGAGKTSMLWQQCGEKVSHA